MLSISIQVAENGTISTFLIAVWYSIEGMRLERRERIFWYVVIIELFLPSPSIFFWCPISVLSSNNLVVVTTRL